MTLWGLRQALKLFIKGMCAAEMTLKNTNCLKGELYAFKCTINNLFSSVLRRLKVEAVIAAVCLSL